jgi:hypothetical protein
MSATLADPLVSLVEIPDTDRVRRRLAVVLTEAAVLRSQLRVSARLEKERDRLRRQGITVAETEGCCE